MPMFNKPISEYKRFMEELNNYDKCEDEELDLFLEDANLDKLKALLGDDYYKDVYVPFIKLNRAFREDDPDAWNNALSELDSDGLFFDYEYPSLEECVKNNKPRIFRNLYEIHTENADMFDDLVYAIISIFNILKNKDRDVFIDMLVDMLGCSLDKYFTDNDFHYIISRINNKADKEAFIEIFTSDDKRKYEDKSYTLESKQVGTLYHVCTLSALVDYIIPENKLSASGKYRNALLNTNNAVSFTRDSLFVVPTWTVDGADILFQFVVDGDKLSERYKITPYQALDWTQDRPTWSEKEEVVKGPIKNFKSYIKEVRFDIKSLKPATLSRQKDYLEKVKEYLGSIKCTRTTLPYHSGDNKHNYKKTKNELELYKIKTLDDLIQYIESVKGIRGSAYSNTLVDTIDSIDLFFKYYDDLSDDQLGILLKKYPKWINIKDKNGYTPLYNACSKENIELAKLLIEHGADVNSKSKYEDTPLYNACYHNYTEVAKLLIEHGADVNFKNRDGYTPLYWACVKDDTEVAKLLLEHGADVNIKQKKYGETPLNVACIKDNIDIVKLLLEYGADVNNKNKNGETPLLWSCKNNKTELVKLLIEYGVDVNIKDKDEWTPLYWVCYRDNIELAKLLLELGADHNIKDDGRETPLYWACYHNNTELAKLLLEHGADVNSESKYGDTPLNRACYHNNTELAKLLIEHGADVNSKDKYGRTPLYHAYSFSNIELAKLLLEHGAGKDFDVNNLPEYITRNKEIEDLIFSYMNKSKNESIRLRRLYRR